MNNDTIPAELELEGWHFTATPKGEPFAVWTSNPNTCAFQVFLDSLGYRPKEVLFQKILINLVVGRHDQGLSFMPQPYDSSQLAKHAQEPYLSQFLERSNQSSTPPYWVFDFLSCDEPTWVPHTVIEKLLDTASQRDYNGIDFQSSKSFADHLGDEQFQHFLFGQGIKLEKIQIRAFQIGVFQSGFRSYSRILDEKMLAVNWLFFYFAAKHPAFANLQENFRSGEAFESHGIHCLSSDSLETPSEYGNMTKIPPNHWQISADWIVHKPILEHGDLIALLEEMTRWDNTGK